jgi:hypothetical protein
LKRQLQVGQQFIHAPDEFGDRMLVGSLAQVLRR